MKNTNEQDWARNLPGHGRNASWPMIIDMGILIVSVAYAAASVSHQMISGISWLIFDASSGVAVIAIVFTIVDCIYQHYHEN